MLPVFFNMILSFPLYYSMIEKIEKNMPTESVPSKNQEISHSEVNRTLYINDPILVFPKTGTDF